MKTCDWLNPMSLGGRCGKPAVLRTHLGRAYCALHAQLVQDFARRVGDPLPQPQIYATAGTELSDRDLIAKAIEFARPHRTTEARRWVAVMDIFGVGSTTAMALCKRFGLDPHETRPGILCHCEDES